jgi:creatinine amidohydrolase
VLRDIRTIAPTGWYGAPQHATVDKALRMLNDIADAIARECTELFRMLAEAQGGTAEIKHLKLAG